MYIELRNLYRQKISWKMVATAALTLCVVASMIGMPHGVAARTVSAQSFGANNHLMQRTSPDRWESVLDAAHDIGMRWGREEFIWDSIEPSDNAYDWTATDEVVAAYEAQGIQMLGLLTYSSAFATTTPGDSHAPPDLDAWEDYVSAVAERYAGRVAAWELWNEPNHSSFFSGTLEEYVELVQRASVAIRSSDPDARIVLGGVSGVDTEFLREVLSSLNRSEIDVVAVHPYRVIGDTFTYTPEEALNGLNTLTTDMRNLEAMLRLSSFADIPVWVTEFGYPNHSTGLTLRAQARLLTRAYALLLSNSRVKKIFWYSLENAGEDGSNQEHRFGLFTSTRELKRSARAHAWFVARLVGARTKGVDTSQWLLFAEPAHLTWNINGAVCTSASLSESDSRLHISYAFTGEENCYLPVAAEQPLPEQTKLLVVRLRGSNDNTTLRVRIRDASGETFQYTLGRMPDAFDWYRVDIDGFAAHWGGDDNGLPEGQLTLDALVLDDQDGSQENGVVVIDSLYTSTAARVHSYRFARNHRPIVMLWSAGEYSDLTYHLASAREARVLRFRASTHVVHDDAIPLTARAMPLVIEMH